MNRIDASIDAFSKFMDEYADKVIAMNREGKFEESGKYSQKGGCPDVGVSALPSDAKGSSRLEFGRCGESAESELNKADMMPSGTPFVAPPLVTEQRPIQDSCGSRTGLDGHYVSGSSPYRVMPASHGETKGFDSPPAGIQVSGLSASDFGHSILDAGSVGVIDLAASPISCGTVEGHGVKSEPRSYRGTTLSISDANDGETAKSRANESKGQSGNQAPPAGIQLEDEEPLWSDSMTTAERYGRGGK